MLRSILPWLRPEEWIFLSFLLLLLLLAALCTGNYGLPGVWNSLLEGVRLSQRREIPFFSSHMTFFLLLGILLYGTILLKVLLRPSPEGRRYGFRRGSIEFLLLLRAYVPFLMCYILYALLRDMIPHLQNPSLDLTLARIELGWFGTLASAGIYDLLHSDAMTFLLSRAYASHFYAPPLVAFLLFLKGDRRNFRDFMLAISISGFLSYAGYILVPAVGPCFLHGWESLRQAHGDDPVLRFVDYWGSRSRDCFPSMHTAWTVITALFLFRMSKPLFTLYVPIGAGLIVACLYLGYHYLIDLPAGALVALGSVAAARTLHSWWYANVRNLTEPVLPASPPADKR